MTTAACIFNLTRQSFLATDLRIADTHWTRLIGLLTTKAGQFAPGRGLWIVPCHGVHTFAMRFAIDVVYLDEKQTVVHLEEGVRPWRITPIRTDAATVVELPIHTICNTETRVGDQLEIEMKHSDSVQQQEEPLPLSLVHRSEESHGCGKAIQTDETCIRERRGGAGISQPG